MAASFSTILIVILISIGGVGLFFLGMSLTQIFKGHDIDSEIATNKNIKTILTCLTKILMPMQKN